MVTGASFSAQQEPPAPWAGGSCCTFTAREVFFPRRSPGKNVIGICSQLCCEFGETGGGPTLRAQSRLRGSRDVHCRGWVRLFGWAGSAPLALRCAVGSLGGCGHLYRSTLARSRDATDGRCAHGCLAGAVFCGALRWRVRAARLGGAVRMGVWRVRSFVALYAGAFARRDWGLGFYILIFGGDLGAF